MRRLIFTLIMLLLHVSVFAQELPKIAVYVTGNVGADEKKALGTRMLASLVNSGRYTAIERSNTFLAEIEREQFRQRSGDIDDSQISKLGKQFGVKFVCIADITPAFGEFQVSARIVDVETAVVAHIGESSGQLASMGDLSRVSDNVVENMFGGKITSAPKRESISGSPQTYTLTVNAVPENGGTVSRNPATHSYIAGTQVTVTAKPYPDYTFAGWDGVSAFAGNSITVTVSDDMALTARFQQRLPEPDAQETSSIVDADPTKPKNKVSIGGGYSMDFHAEPSPLGSIYGGWDLYIDLIYAKAFVGLFSTLDNNNDTRTFSNFGAFLKYPFNSWLSGIPVKYFPLVGGAFDSPPPTTPFDPLWLMFGVGMDMFPGVIYLRYEIVLGVIPNRFGDPDNDFRTTITINIGFRL